MTAEQIEKNIIPAVFERPVNGKIKYAGLNSQGSQNVNDLYSAVFNRYVPRVPLSGVPMDVRIRNGWNEIPEEIVTGEEKVETGEVYQRATGGHKAGDPKTELVKQKEVTLVPDPDVIWVGRITDGLVWLGVVESRARLKDFLHNVPSGEIGTSARCQMVLERGDDRFEFGPRLLDEEPGEITNSPQSRRIERRENQDLNIDDPMYESMAFEPRIRRYPNFDLHFLKRGDQVTFTAQGWPRPRTNGGEPWTMRFVLRPPSEGPSHVASNTGVDPTIRLV